MAFRRQLHDPLEDFIEYLMPSWSVRPADPWFSFSGDSQQQDPRNRSDADRSRGFLVRFPSRSVPEKARSDGAMDVQVTDSEFKVAVNVRSFQPEELDVKQIVDDNVIIHGKHEEKSDEHGHISREFVRRYKLPPDVDANEVASSLSHDGVLSIKGKRKTNQPAEKVIPISVEQKPQVEGGSSEQKEKEEK
ncbi:Alpha-crystallin B chain [Holothuria leucospilota]|uniref:Alpha-crystallin B chain n=1 Tax=Holothuria leucospilota TaxID=206669 RepID=A0A9Q1CBT9_HOLLE|nr:Alpha-crystallin B chain [Holothuria leucospilota]